VKPRTMIGAPLLRAVGASQANAIVYAPLLDAAVVVPGDPFYSITSQNGVAMLVAQLAHESGGFASVVENLNYSVEALAGMSRFTKTQAKQLGRSATQKANQEAIANIMYGGRMGNVQAGDGWLFRGGGPLQLTGRSNYTAWGKAIGKTAEEAAEYVRTPEGGVSAALWFWRVNGLLVPASRGDVSACTRIINGGYNGLADRVSRFKSVLAFITGAT